MKITYSFLIMIILLSCHKQMKFDKKSWNSDDIDDKINYELRYEMLGDLLTNYNLKGKSIQEIQELMGNTNEKGHDDQKTQDALIYTVLIKWRGIDPVYYKFSTINKSLIVYLYLKEKQIKFKKMRLNLSANIINFTLPQ